ncbi:MAG: hypothetical protein RL758_179 [Pseudomonadota bacterium]
MMWVSMPTIRPRRCDARKGGCGEMFTPSRPMQKACSPKCAADMVSAKKLKDAEKAKAEDKRKTREQLENLKTVPELKKEAQREFNRYVRLRDAGKGCFVCGETLILGGVGGGFDAGHIRSRSNADNLRFDERNVHGQCKRCNAAGATKDWEMREAADRLLGPEVAAALYADNRVHKWQRDELREIRDTSRAKANALEKGKG